MNMEVVTDTPQLRIEKMELGSWATNSYIIQCSRTGKCALVDVPPGALTIIKELAGRVPECVLLTHNHVDHIAGLQAFRNRLNVPLAVHTLDNREWLPFSPEILLKDGQSIRIGDLEVEVLHTPGHTPGSVSFKTGRYLIAGDTLFPGGPGRTTTPQDFAQILETIEKKILPLPDDTQVYPGHGVHTSVREARLEYAGFKSRPHPEGLFGDIEWKTS
jgi:glyoxylase-like metal-dependent hydrolase (beta-lactamase superfamily II)